MFVTMDKTLVHHYAPKSKHQFKEWKRVGSLSPKKSKNSFVVEKGFDICFLGFKGGHLGGLSRTG